MQVKDIMTQALDKIESTASLTEAAKHMSYRDVGILPVSKADQIVGVITDRDIVIRGLAQDKQPGQTTVSEVMTTNLIFCSEGDDIHEAGKLMEEKQVRRLLVSDQNDKLVGVLSLGDLAAKCGEDIFSGEVLEAISEPATPLR
ncbi:Hypoxic response protein 1 [Anaerohalosphaera lusitana]|uniref:Hypoxic response protein 1 n=1 Tax=Anaerohalosphaera lusitana TaxID=1936003 RepID=A0A1U9NJX4_9BACT|nr:CBS domain-containing protein [Anaerohalosphaera lusitana]AQT68222.1 Hypoxic response protein 1 [Anaerohalosphaera lusitana]